jgi:peptidoglycan hydrolase-like protein with peptidoglycan-binding domain
MTSSSPGGVDPKAIKSLSEFVKLNAPAVFITEIQSELVSEIQELLKIDVDGIVGPLTKQAFADFKARNNLEYPLGLGVSTAKELLELKDKEETASDDGKDLSPQATVSPDAGSRTGNSMKLPSGQLVYANEYVIAGIPLTWGEITANCTRVPTANEYVENAIKVVRNWGEVREKFGSPIRITSGYRPPAVNKAVGGVSNSQHLYFRAIDMQPLNGDFRKLWEVLKASKFTGLGDAVFMGRNKGFFHADIRPGSRIIFPY